MTPTPPTMRYVGADGAERVFPVVAARRVEARGEQGHVDVRLPAEEWRLLEGRVDKINDEFHVHVNGLAFFSGRLVDVDQDDEVANIQLGSWEEDARDAEPTSGGTRFENVTDDAIALDAIGRVPGLTAGTVEETTPALSMVFPRSSPTGMLRSLARTTGAWVVYRANKSVDYVGTLGRDRSAIAGQVLEEAAGTVGRLHVIRDTRDEFTHLLVLGAGEGDAQITASAEAASYTLGTRQVWRRLQDKDVVTQAQADAYAAALVAEADAAPRLLRVEASDVAVEPPPSLGDQFRVRSPDGGGVDAILRVIRVEAEAGPDGVSYSVELCNRPQHEESDATYEARQLSRFAGGYEGVSVPINATGGRQPVQDGIDYVFHVDYPEDVVKELKALLLVDGLPYRAYSRGGAAGGATILPKAHAIADRGGLVDATEYGAQSLASGDVADKALESATSGVLDPGVSGAALGQSIENETDKQEEPTILRNWVTLTDNFSVGAGATVTRSYNNDEQAILSVDDFEALVGMMALDILTNTIGDSVNVRFILRVSTDGAQNFFSRTICQFQVTSSGFPSILVDRSDIMVLARDLKAQGATHACNLVQIQVTNDAGASRDFVGHVRLRALDRHRHAAGTLAGIQNALTPATAVADDRLSGSIQGGLAGQTPTRLLAPGTQLTAEDVEDLVAELQSGYAASSGGVGAVLYNQDGEAFHEEHEHALEAGVIEEFPVGGQPTQLFPTDVDVVVNGVPLGLSLGDGLAGFQELVDVKGLLVPGFNEIRVTSATVGHIQAHLALDVFRQVFAS